MVQFITLRFSSLSSSAHYNFFRKLKAMIASCSQTITDAIASFIPAFDALFAEEEILEEWVRKSDLTKEIEDADKVMDTALAALRTTIRGMRTFSVASDAKAAIHVYTMLMSYGNITKKPYEAQSGDVASILKLISAGGAYYDSVGVLKKAAPIVGGMIVDLTNALNTFEKLLAQRDTDRHKKPERTWKEVRRDIDAIYHKITLVINANAVTGASPDFENFIIDLNPEIERLNAEFHRAKKSLSAGKRTVIEPVETQPYIEGIPATPVPVVHYREDEKPTVRLSMGKDFVVSYKNNDYVGMAEAIIHGKGDYKGSKSVTFMIAR